MSDRRADVLTEFSTHPTSATQVPRSSIIAQLQRRRHASLPRPAPASDASGAVRNQWSGADDPELTQCLPTTGRCGETGEGGLTSPTRLLSVVKTSTPSSGCVSKGAGQERRVWCRGK